MDKSLFIKLTADFFSPEVRAWHGEQPLWKVFWVYGVVTSAALIAFYVLGFYLDHVAMRQALLLFFAAYTAWILVSVWRCANNAHERIWGFFARFLIVAWGCNTVLVLVFLQFNLIIKYYLQY